MNSKSTLMHQEILEIPKAVEKLLSQGDAPIQAIAKKLRTIDPSFLTTVARGSSDHVCTYLKYVCEISLGIPVASIGPSIASIFHAPLKLKNSASIIVSQSGKSPDIVEMATLASERSSLAIAITNDLNSPLAKTCTHTLDCMAGVEASVAATKTFICSAVAGLAVLAHWKKDMALIAAIHDLPEYLGTALQNDWSELADLLIDKNSIYVLGRGPTQAISNEAALKFKETCQLHAESYSSAEVLHGPIAIVEAQFPVLIMASRDASEGSIVQVGDQLAARGAAVFVTSEKVKQANSLAMTRTGHSLTDPLALLVSFYTFVEKLSLLRGGNPDKPPHLKKITETI